MLLEQEVIARQTHDLTPSAVIDVKPSSERRRADAIARRRRAEARNLTILNAQKEERQRIQEEIVTKSSGVFPGGRDLVSGGPDKRAIPRVVSKLRKAVKSASERNDPRKPVLGEKRHINTEWDGSSYLLDGTPVTDAEFDLAWTEAPIVVRPGAVVEFEDPSIDPEEVGNTFASEIVLEPGVPVDPFRTDSSSYEEPESEFDPDIMLTVHESVEGISLDLLRERVSGNGHNGHFQQQVAVNAGTQWDQKQ